MTALLALLAAILLLSSSSPSAQAKGPVRFTFCGEQACVGRSAPRFTVAMLYGGHLHAAPACRTRVHAVTATFLPSSERRRYLLVASRGLIGEQGRHGYVWWRKVKGAHKSDLVRAVRGTGRGFTTITKFPIGLESRHAAPRRWRLVDDYTWSGRLSCALKASHR